MTHVVLCTGPSMTQAIADSVRHLPTIAVNTTYELAPWAIAVCANDSAFWRAYPAALKHKGRKFCTSRVSGVERVALGANISTSSCSLILALEVAKNLGAQRVVLFGVDFSGSHYFGPYERGLNNTSDPRRLQHAVQIKRWAKANPKMAVLNCTTGSHLKAFPMATLESILEACDMPDKERAALSA